MSRNSQFLLGISIAVLLFMSSSFAEIPQIINYQGKVTDTGGQVVADGSYGMEFSIFDTATGGTALWSSGVITVTVSGGVFSVILGEGPQPALTLGFDGYYWLEVAIEGDIQSPRSQLGSVGYAYMASGLVPETEIISEGDAPVLKAVNLTTVGVKSGLWGEIASTEGQGVFGLATSSTGGVFGIAGESHSTDGSGIIGRNAAASGFSPGVMGESMSEDGTGVYGVNEKTTGITFGVYGMSASTNGRGVYGKATETSGSSYGGYFEGSVGVVGDGIYEGVNGQGNVYGVYGYSDSDIAGTGVYGEAAATEGISYGVFGRINSTTDSAAGVYGQALASSGLTHGGYFENLSAYGYGLSASGFIGVYGAGSGSAGTGVYGNAQVYGTVGRAQATTGTGVYGWASALTGSTYAVHGKVESPDGTGLYGEAAATSGLCRGVVGETSSTYGDGVYGHAIATSGFAYGVYGRSESTSGRGVFGYANATSGSCDGVYGQTDSPHGRAVVGYATASAGGDTACAIYAESLSPGGSGIIAVGNSGVKGYGATTGGYFEGEYYAVYGITKIAGSAAPNCAVRGNATATTGSDVGVYGKAMAPSGTGVTGDASATTGSAVGVFGVTSAPSGSGVYYSGGLAGTGSKSCVVEIAKGPSMLFCQESPECWFEDFGEGLLTNGRARIELNEEFMQTVTIDDTNPMKVFVQLGGDCRGVYVERDHNGFDVIELQGGSATVPFAYRVVAKRKGFEAKRLPICEIARSDPYLYPELREQVQARDVNVPKREARKVGKDHYLSLKN